MFKCPCGYISQLWMGRCPECQKFGTLEPTAHNLEMTDDEFFELIWIERPHFSEVSGTSLNYTFGKAMYFVFSHVVTKGSHIDLRRVKRNIVLMTREEHDIWEFRRHTVKHQPRWRFVFELHKELTQPLNS